MWAGIRGRQKLRHSICHLLWYSAGAILPFALTCLLLWRAGVFAKFWFWTFSYAYEYATNFGVMLGCLYFLKNFSRILFSSTALWILAAVGLISFLWSRKSRAHADFLLGLLFFSALAVSAGFYFRAHYFIMLLPAASLLAGLAVSSATDCLNRSSLSVMRDIPLAIFVLALTTALFQEAWFFFKADPISACRYVYPRDSFPEAAVVGKYIGQHISPNASVAVLGSEPQIMFYSRHRSVTGYLYGYSLTEEQKYAATMQREVISEIEAANPEYFVFVEDWVVRPRTDTDIFAWYGKYTSLNYDLIGVMRKNDGLQFRSREEIALSPGNLEGALLLYHRTKPFNSIRSLPRSAGIRPR